MLARSPSGRHYQPDHHLVMMHLLNVAARKVAGLTAHASEWLLGELLFAVVVKTV